MQILSGQIRHGAICISDGKGTTFESLKGLTFNCTCALRDQDTLTPSSHRIMLPNCIFMEKC